MKALLSGVSGQDGSYLSELLLEKGYEVFGIIRRNSVSEHQESRIHGLDVKTFYGDVLDQSSLKQIMSDVKPDEIYNLAAQSHVRVSFDIPQFTTQTNAIGVINMLEAYKQACPNAKFYQASSSEMFGNSIDPDGFQRESTPMHPVSPYGCAKLFGYSIVRHYRNAYGLFASNGILFNHETISEDEPIIFNKDNKIDIKPINEIVEFVNQSKKTYQCGPVSDIKVWDHNDWTNVKYASAYPHDIKNDNKHPKVINSRNGVYTATGSHVVFTENDEVETSRIKIGDRLKNIELPKNKNKTNECSMNEAALIGMMVADGSITYSKKGIGVSSKFTKNNPVIRKKFSKLWNSVTGGCCRLQINKSPFNGKNVYQLCLTGGSDWLRSIDLYTKDKHKKIPKIILNSTNKIYLEFLRYYNMCDGLKKNKCKYEFKNFKTNSKTLAMGLIFLIKNTTNQDINISVEIRNNKFYYSINLLSPNGLGISRDKYKIVKHMLSKKISQREICRKTSISRSFIRKVQNGYSGNASHFLKKDSNGVKKIINFDNYNGWFYDLETESGHFHAGIGSLLLHNSPRRGSNFVTNKVVKTAVQIKKGLVNNLVLGNMDSYRDWGHSKDYVRAMNMILGHKEPDDFVISTMKTHSVRDLCKYVFNKLDLDLNLIKQDAKYMRPEELKYLQGDSTKAREILGWNPEYTFKSMLDEMIKHWESIL